MSFLYRLNQRAPYIATAAIAFLIGAMIAYAMAAEQGVIDLARV